MFRIRLFVTIYALAIGSSPIDITLTRLMRLPFLPMIDFQFISGVFETAIRWIYYNDELDIVEAWTNSEHALTPDDFTAIVANYKAHGWKERSAVDDNDA